MDLNYFLVDYDEKENNYSSFINYINNRNIYIKNVKSSNTYTFLLTQRFR